MKVPLSIKNPIEDSCIHSCTQSGHKSVRQAKKPIFLLSFRHYERLTSVFLLLLNVVQDNKY